VESRQPPGQDGASTYLDDAKDDTAWVIEESIRGSGGTHRTLVEELARLGFSGSSEGGTLGPTTISNWIARKHPPNAWILVSLIRRFGLSLDQRVWGPGLRYEVDRLRGALEVTRADMDALKGIIQRHINLSAAERETVDRIGRSAAPGD